MSPYVSHLLKESPSPCSGRERGHGRTSTQEQIIADPATSTFIKLSAEVTNPPLLAGTSRWEE